MKKAIRCFLSCIFPCGVLDVIRIVHCSGKVEEISGKVRASEIMEAYPKHVLKKPSTSSSYDESGTVVSKIVIVAPDAELQRGKIYFLMPVPSSRSAQGKGASNSRTSSRKKRRLDHHHESDKQRNIDMSMRDKKRGGHAGVWRPSLDSVSEILSVCSGKSDE